MGPSLVGAREPGDLDSYGTEAAGKLGHPQLLAYRVY